MKFFSPIILILLFASCSSEGDQSVINQSKNQASSGLTLLSYEETGIDFQNEIKENGQMNVLMYEYYHNGGGVAIGDINNDGLPDIYFTSTLFSNKLYLNKGNFKFEDITEKSGTNGSGGLTTGVTMVDVNSDGLLDIYVCQSGNFESEKRKNKLFVNQGNLSFKENAEVFGLADDAFSTQAYFFDVDNDNDLDMFLLNHQVNSLKGDALANSKIYDPNAGDKMYINTNGKFVDESSKYNLEQNKIGYGLSASVSDFNNDGFQDIYICNDYIEHDYFYINLDGKSFEEQSSILVQKHSNFSMGSDVGDINNDGLQDLFVADMAAADNYRVKTNMSGMSPEKFKKNISSGFGHQYMYNTLQINRGLGSEGDLRFSEVAQMNNLATTDWSWAPLFLDLNNDTYLDLFITNGLRKEARNNDFIKRKKEHLVALQNASDNSTKDHIIRTILKEMPSEKLSNYFFKNNSGIGFENASFEFEITEHKSFSNGMSYGDLDNDGDLDLVINNIDEIAFIYKNNSKNNFIKFKLKGPENNSLGIGARIKVTLNDGTILLREMLLARGYLSSVDPVVHFGLGSQKSVKQTEVLWPDGRSQVIVDNKVNALRYIDYVDSKSIAIKNKGKSNLFVKSILPKTAFHTENDFDDFERELLLPHKMSQEGPALAVSDINGDGLDDFYLGSSFGNKGKMFIQKDDGNYKQSIDDIWESTIQHEEVAAEFFDIDSDGDQDLYVVSGGNEKADLNSYQDRIYINDGKGKFVNDSKVLSPVNFSGSCVKSNDFDKDGDVDLFVGGRQNPGRYPLPGHSFLLLNDGKNGFEKARLDSTTFASMGMVTDAVWSDYNNDGWDDLIVVGEWMPVSIFINNKGVLKSTPIKIPISTGWWNCITSSDLNNDGKDDFILGNLGLNYKYKASQDETFNIYASDFDHNNTLDIVLSYSQNNTEFPLRGRQCSSEQMPFIKEKFKNYDAFGRASLVDVFTEEGLNESINYKVDNFHNMVLISTPGAEYKFQKLPASAQQYTIQSIATEDVDNNGWLDVIIGGNLLGSEVETPKSDACYGEILLNNGNGKLISVLNHTGFDVRGQVSNVKSVNSLGKYKILFATSNNDLYLYEKR